jgi:hypothetical protein
LLDANFGHAFISAGWLEGKQGIHGSQRYLATTTDFKEAARAASLEGKQPVEAHASQLERLKALNR